MDDEKSAKYPGHRMVLRGSMRLVLRPRCEGGDERPVLLGTHWKTGAEVVLREFEPEDACFYPPGPAVEVMQEREEDIAQSADAYLYDPDAKDPPNRVGFTTSHPDYDHCCTVEVERFTCTVFPGERAREFRQVVVRGGSGFSLGQLMRYNDWVEEDPRVTRDRWAAQRAQRAAEDAAEAKEAAEDEARFAAMTIPELEAEYERRRAPDVWDRAAELRHQRIKRVLPARRQAALDAAWAALQARVREGRTVLVPGRDRRRRTDPWLVRQYGEWEPGSPAYLLHVVCPQWCPKETPIAERLYSVQTDKGHEHRGSPAEVVAGWFDAGYETDDYPSLELRRKFYKRLSSYIVDAPRAVVDGRTYYLGTPRFSSDLLVLDAEEMNLCRSKKVRDLVAAAHRWHEGRKTVADSIAYHEALPEDDERRGKLAALRERLAAGDAAKPAEFSRVSYTRPSLPVLPAEPASWDADGDGQ
jgi:hypothetical protein